VAPCDRFLAAAPQAIAKRDGRIDPVRSSSVLLNMVEIVSRFIIVIAYCHASFPSTSSHLNSSKPLLKHSGLSLDR
jgi:hypothetical protein